MAKKISQAVVKRLPRYYRYLETLENEGVSRVSSSSLAELLDITASQVRQDFCNFGGFGQQGYGYDVSKLKKEIQKIIGLDRNYNLIIIGAGNIGRALAGYKGFSSEGFFVKALFDVKVDEKETNGVGIYHMDALGEYVKNNKVDIAVITTQGSVAPNVCDELVSLGIKNIWNFAPIDLSVPSGVTVENISMSESLYVLSYRMNNEA